MTTELLQAAGVVLRDTTGAVLMLQRPDGSWCIPGGKLEAGETPLQGAIRETAEETGKLLSPSECVPLAQVSNPDGFKFTGYAATVERFDPVLGDGEHAAWQWATLDALPQPLFMQSEGFIALALNAPQGCAMDEALSDANGWREFPDNPISRVGVFQYSGKQISPDLPADEIFNVLRPAEELSDPEAIESIKLLPWIAGHTMLGDKFTPAEQKGVGGVVGERVYFKEGVLYGNLKIFSSAHDALIAQGLKDLSLGYRCRYEYAPGTFEGQPYDYVQRHIRGNHIATVPEGRMGSLVAVQDSFTFDAKETFTMADTDNKDGENAVSKIDPAAMTLPELLALLEKIKPLIADMQKAAAVASGENDEEESEEAKAAKAAAAAASGDNTDTTNGDPSKGAATVDEDDEEKKKDAIAEDAALRTFRAMGKRDALARKLFPVVGVFDHSEMTPAEVAAYGCKKLGLSPAKGNEAATLDGYLAGVNAAGGQRVTKSTTHAMDGADASAKPAWMAHMNDEA